MHSNAAERRLFFSACFQSHFPEKWGRYRTHNDTTLIQVILNFPLMSATDRYNCQLASKGNTSTLQLTTEIWDKLLRSGRPGLFLHGAYHRRKQRKRKSFSQSGLLKALVKGCCAILLLPKPGSALQHAPPRAGWTKADQPRTWVGRKNAAMFISMKNYVTWATVP